MIQTIDHVAEGLALLITQYKGKTNMEGFLAPYLTQVQELEDMFFDLLGILIDMDSQVGEQLNILGRIVGQDREGRTDAVYLQWIRARILVNRSSGLPDEILRILALVVPGLERVYKKYPPASFVAEVLGIFTGDPEAVAAIIKEARAAGVGAQFVYSLQAKEDTFAWATADVEEASTTQGWGDNAQTTGGRFAGIESA